MISRPKTWPIRPSEQYVRGTVFARHTTSTRMPPVCAGGVDRSDVVHDQRGGRTSTTIGIAGITFRSDNGRARFHMRNEGRPLCILLGGRYLRPLGRRHCLRRLRARSRRGGLLSCRRRSPLSFSRHEHQTYVRHRSARCALLLGTGQRSRRRRRVPGVERPSGLPQSRCGAGPLSFGVDRRICYTVVGFLTAALPAFRIRFELLASPAFRRRAHRSSLPSDFVASFEMQE
jgi:hypothetical protein